MDKTKRGWKIVCLYQRYEEEYIINEEQPNKNYVVMYKFAFFLVIKTNTKDLYRHSLWATKKHPFSDFGFVILFKKIKYVKNYFKR